jgi:hypothetical protein
MSGAELGLSTEHPLSKRDDTVSGIDEIKMQGASMLAKPTTPRGEVNPALIESLREQATQSVPVAA